MKKELWAGRILSGAAVVFLLFDAAIHVIKPAAVVEAFAQLGYPVSLALGIGILEFACVAVYLVPRTSIFGAILLTGYLGGATASQLRVSDSLFQLLFPSIVGSLVWGGLYLRDSRLRALIPVDLAGARSTSM
jgi:hypothetical protein